MTDTVTSTSTSATTILYDYLLEQGIDEQVSALSALAVELRDADESAAKREETGRSDLVAVIVQLLQRADAQDAAHRAKLYEQAGRVVANLVADNDPNRAAILQTDYIAVASKYVDAELGADGEERRSMEHEEKQQAARRAVIASLLNLVIQGHEALGAPRNLLHLANISTGLYRKLRSDASKEDEARQGDQEEELIEGYDAVLGWVWTILSTAICDSKTDEAILPGTLGALFLPLLTPSDLHPTALESTDERFIQAAECLASITSRKTPASVWTAPFSPAVADFAYPYNAQDTSSPIAALLALIEHANGGEEEEYAKSKAQLAYALVDLGSVLPLIPTPAPLTTSSSPTSTTLTSATLQDVTTLRKAFDTLCAWTAPLRRDDLRMSALLTIGNAITSNSICVALLSTPAGDELARNAIQALQGTDQVQHAAMGFLRNLSVPLENKAKLGKRAMGIWDGLVQADVWGEGKDMLGSVQGGAVGLVKNLCRDTLPNVQNFLSLPSATPSLLALHKRTDDPAIRFEIARIYVNCIRAVFASRPPNPNAADSGSGADGEGETPSSREATTAPATSAEALAQLTSDGVAQITADMLAQSAQYPILANESIIALALLATFGGEDAGALLQTKLHQPPILDVLISILCPTAEAPSSRETRANAVTLLHSRGLDGVRKAVRARLGEVQRAADDQREMSDEGRELCAGAD